MSTRTLRTVVMAAGLALAAASAPAQEATFSGAHKHLGVGRAFQHLDVAGRVEQLDARIAMLREDMRMFAGEMKIQVMADLIEALIERQYLIDLGEHPRREMMDEWMPHARPPAAPHAAPDPGELDPESMCSPYI